MSKIKLKIYIKNPFEEAKIYDIYGIKKDGDIIYKEENVKSKITIADNALSINRITDEYELGLFFKNGKILLGNYNIKGAINIAIYTKTNRMIINKYKVFLDYNLFINNEDLGNYLFKLEYEVIK